MLPARPPRAACRASRIRRTFATRRRLGARSIGALLVVRFLLIGNGLVVLAVGALYVLYGARPTGFVVGGCLAAVAVLLFACVPLTDPYRHERRR